jgi:hypothetical protein
MMGLRTNKETRFAVCLNNSAYPDDLKIRTLCQVLPDDSAAKSNYIRVIDETGEDYLYPAEYFVFVVVSPEAAKALMIQAS